MANRRAPDPSPGATGNSVSDDKASEEIQNSVATIWMMSLGLSRVDRNEDFFDAGGDSAAAVRLLTEIAKKYSVDIDVYDLMDHSNIISLSLFLEQEINGKDSGRGR